MCGRIGVFKKLHKKRNYFVNLENVSSKFPSSFRWNRNNFDDEEISSRNLYCNAVGMRVICRAQLWTYTGFSELH